mgnify:FL=1
MNFIEKFGGWVIANSSFTLPFFVFATFVVAYISIPDFVTIDAKHWECTKSMPEGIKAQCIEYRYKGK